MEVPLSVVILLFPDPPSLVASMLTPGAARHVSLAVPQRLENVAIVFLSSTATTARICPSYSGIRTGIPAMTSTSDWDAFPAAKTDNRFAALALSRASTNPAPRAKSRNASNSSRSAKASIDAPNAQLLFITRAPAVIAELIESRYQVLTKGDSSVSSFGIPRNTTN